MGILELLMPRFVSDESILDSAALEVAVERPVERDGSDGTPARGAEDPHLMALLLEYSRVTEAIRVSLGRSERILGLGFTVVGAAVAVGLRYEIPEAVIFAPFGLCALGFYVAALYTDVMNMGGYTRNLEERLNHRLRDLGGVDDDQRTFVWESIGRKLSHTAPGGHAFNLVALLIGVGMGALGIQAAFLHYTWVGGLVTTILLLVCFSGLLWIARDGWNAWDRSLNLARRLSGVEAHRPVDDQGLQQGSKE